jgi:hypothetical protein
VLVVLESKRSGEGQERQAIKVINRRGNRRTASWVVSAIGRFARAEP